MKHVFGPVYSRRLGQSLGIDPLIPKTCNWNCVYCQLGRTPKLTNDRQPYVAVDTIIRQVEEALRRPKTKKLDWVSFVGAGEPTLHSQLGWMIRAVKGLTDVPVAVFTNGSLLHDPEVAEDLKAADAVLPSLDVGSEPLFLRMHRPHSDHSLASHVGGLESFRHVFAGRYWVEVMLVEGLNDSDQSLQQTQRLLDRINPDEIHLSVPTRPPGETWVRPPERERLVRAREIMGAKARVLFPEEPYFDLSVGENTLEGILAIISRHPMAHDELLEMVRAQCDGSAEQVVEALRSSGRARVVVRNGKPFWSSVDAGY